MVSATYKNILLKSLPLATVSAAVLAVHPSDAAIIGSSVQGGYKNQPETQRTLELQIVEPPPEGIILGNLDNFEDGNYTVDPNPNPAVDLFGIIEKQSVVLPQSIEVWDRFDRQTSDFNVTIPEGTLVSSYLFYVNPPGGDEPTFEWSGQIQFDATVLGIVSGYSKRSWQPTTQLVGLENTKYRIGAGLDRHQEVVTFEDNVLNFYISARSGTEPFRVITSGNSINPAVPEPLTLMGTGIALGFIPLLKGAYSRKHRHTKKNVTIK